jgi:hypothetical protein
VQSTRSNRSTGIWFDNWTSSHRSREQREKDSGRQALAAISPLAAFSAFDQTEKWVKDLFLMTTDRIVEKLDVLIKFAAVLSGKLDKIQEVLDHLQATAVDEIGNLPTQDTLRALWTLLAQPGDKKVRRLNAVYPRFTLSRRFQSHLAPQCTQSTPETSKEVPGG